MNDNEICWQKVCLNPSLVLYFGNYEFCLDRLCTQG